MVKDLNLREGVTPKQNRRSYRSYNKEKEPRRIDKAVSENRINKEKEFESERLITKQEKKGVRFQSEENLEHNSFASLKQRYRDFVSCKRTNRSVLLFSVLFICIFIFVYAVWKLCTASTAVQPNTDDLTSHINKTHLHPFYKGSTRPAPTHRNRSSPVIYVPIFTKFSKSVVHPTMAVRNSTNSTEKPVTTKGKEAIPQVTGRIQTLSQQAVAPAAVQWPNNNYNNYYQYMNMLYGTNQFRDTSQGNKRYMIPSNYDNQNGANNGMGYNFQQGEGSGGRLSGFDFLLTRPRTTPKPETQQPNLWTMNQQSYYNQNQGMMSPNNGLASYYNMYNRGIGQGVTSAEPTYMYNGISYRYPTMNRERMSYLGLDDPNVVHDDISRNRGNLYGNQFLQAIQNFQYPKRIQNNGLNSEYLNQAMYNDGDNEMRETLREQIATTNRPLLTTPGTTYMYPSSTPMPTTAPVKVENGVVEKRTQTPTGTDDKIAVNVVINVRGKNITVPLLLNSTLLAGAGNQEKSHVENSPSANESTTQITQTSTIATTTPTPTTNLTTPTTTPTTPTTTPLTTPTTATTVLSTTPSFPRMFNSGPLLNDKLSRFRAALAGNMAVHSTPLDALLRFMKLIPSQNRKKIAPTLNVSGKERYEEKGADDPVVIPTPEEHFSSSSPPLAETRFINGYSANKLPNDFYMGGENVDLPGELETPGREQNKFPSSGYRRKSGKSRGIQKDSLHNSNRQSTNLDKIVNEDDDENFAISGSYKDEMKTIEKERALESRRKGNSKYKKKVRRVRKNRPKFRGHEVYLKILKKLREMKQRRKKEASSKHKPVQKKKKKKKQHHSEQENGKNNKSKAKHKHKSKAKNKPKHKPKRKGKKTKNDSKNRRKKKKKKKKKPKRQDQKSKPKGIQLSHWKKVNFKIKDCNIFKRFDLTNIVSLRKMAESGKQHVYEVLLCTLRGKSTDENGKPVYKCTLMTFKLNGYMFLRRKKVASNYEFELYVCKNWAGLNVLYSKFAKEESDSRKSVVDSKIKMIQSKKYSSIGMWESEKQSGENRKRKTRGKKKQRSKKHRSTHSKKRKEKKYKGKHKSRKAKKSSKKKGKKVLKRQKSSFSKLANQKDHNVSQGKHRKSRSREKGGKGESNNDGDDDRYGDDGSELPRDHYSRPSRRFSLLSRLEQRNLNRGDSHRETREKPRKFRDRQHKNQDHAKRKKHQHDEETENEEPDDEETANQDSKEGGKRSRVRHRFRNYLIKKLKSRKSNDDDGIDSEEDVEGIPKRKESGLRKKEKLIRLMQARKARRKKKAKLSISDFEDDLSNLRKRSNDQAEVISDDPASEEGINLQAKERHEANLEDESPKDADIEEGRDKSDSSDEATSDVNLSDDSVAGAEGINSDSKEIDNTIYDSEDAESQRSRKSKRKTQRHEVPFEEQNDNDFENDKHGNIIPKGTKRKQPLYGDIGDEEEFSINNPIRNKKHRHAKRLHQTLKHHHDTSRRKSKLHNRRGKGGIGYARRSFIPGMNSVKSVYHKGKKSSSHSERDSLLNGNDIGEDEDDDMDTDDGSGIGSGIDDYGENGRGGGINNGESSKYNDEQAKVIGIISSGDDEGYDEDIDLADNKNSQYNGEEFLDKTNKKKSRKHAKSPTKRRFNGLTFSGRHRKVNGLRHKHGAQRNGLHHWNKTRRRFMNEGRKNLRSKGKHLRKALLKSAKIHLKNSYGKKDSHIGRRNVKTKGKSGKKDSGKPKHGDTKYKGMLQNLMDMMSNIKDKISGKGKSSTKVKENAKMEESRGGDKTTPKSSSRDDKKIKSHYQANKVQPSEDSVKKIVEAVLPVVMKNINPLNSTHEPPTVLVAQTEKPIKLSTSSRSKPSASKTKPDTTKAKPTTAPSQRNTPSRHHSIHHKTTKRPSHQMSTRAIRKDTTKRHHTTPVKTPKKIPPTIHPHPHPKTTVKPSHRPTTRKKHTTIQLDMIMKGLRALGIKNIPKPSPSPKPVKHKTSVKVPLKRTPTKGKKGPSPKTPSLPMRTKPPIPVPIHLRAPNQLNVLCFGDSLTAGYYHHGKGFFPYGDRLRTILNQNLRIQSSVQTKGIVGEMTHKQMTTRLPMVLGNMTKQVDWVIILGGTNDILHVKNFADDQEFLNQLENVWQPRITKDIEKLHQISYAYGAHTMLLTIPENAIEVWPEYKLLMNMRKKINNALRRFANTSKGKTVLCDLAKQFQRHSLSPALESLYWDDHLHMTPAGYNRMANIVFKCLKPYIPPGAMV